MSERQSSSDPPPPAAHPASDSGADPSVAATWKRRLKEGLERLPWGDEEEETGPFSFEEVFRDELKTIRRRQGADGEPDPDPAREAFRRPLVGVSLSGGGIRSATFNLGVLQALARLNLLRFVDYLSTVSGGGYIGGWLVAWLYGEEHRARRRLTDLAEYARRRGGETSGSDGVGAESAGSGAEDSAIDDSADADADADVDAEDADAALGPDRGEAMAALLAASASEASETVRNGLAREAFTEGAARPTGEPSPIGFLRRFSNYLAPKAGLLSIDSWTIVATYLRNMILNLTIVLLTVTAVLLLPRLWLSWILGSTGGPHVFELRTGLFPSKVTADSFWVFNPQSELPLKLAAVAFLALLVGLIFTSFSLERRTRNVMRWVTQPRVVLFTVVAPFFLAAVLLAHWLPLARWAPAEMKGRPQEAAESAQSRGSGTLDPSRSVGESERPAPVGEVVDEDSIAADEELSFLQRFASIFSEAWLVYWSFWLVAFLIAVLTGVIFRWRGVPGRIDLLAWVWAVTSALVAGLAGGWALEMVASTLHHLVRDTNGANPSGWVHVTTIGPPLIVTVVVLIGVLHVGLMGREFGEDRREVWSRIGAYLMIANLCWLGLFGSSFYGAPALLWMRQELPTVATTTGIGWVLATVAGLLFGHLRGRKEGEPPRWIALVARAAPFVFVGGLVLWLSIVVQWLHGLLLEHGVPLPFLPVEAPAGDWVRPFEQPVRTIVAAAGTDLSALGVTIALLLAMAVVLSLRVDVNEFSMHHFYRSRLVRCYLGASRRRRPNLFTGFDPDDDFPLDRLDSLESARSAPTDARGAANYSGPYPIFNSTLNLAAGEELAWQQRRAAPFVFTPRYYGWDTGETESRRSAPGSLLDRLGRTFAAAPHGFRRTKHANDGRGVSLGTAMGISGAAVSPQMGDASSPALSFLMTIFNARLGWWMGNPKREKSWQLPGPRLSLLSLMRELLGAMGANAKYVSLSDGGFFDNLGLFELVRRRCRFIIVCDAEGDPRYEFNGLGNAIRRCRSDLGVEIDLDVDPIRQRNARGFSRWHCAVGRISYKALDPSAPRGILVYLKASLTGDEPEDIQNYRAQRPNFPHESTGDQSFVESQFESYRMLGYHVATQVFEAAPGVEAQAPVRAREEISNEEALRNTEDRDLRRARTDHNIESVFVALEQAWYPPSGVPTDIFTRHARRLDEIFERLRSEESLAFLDDQLFVELEEWRRGRPKVAETVEPARSPETTEPARSPETTEPARSPETAEPVRSAEAVEVPEEDFRAGFYVCNSMVQLMESVYLDLDLEAEWRHPDNRGWMNMFRHWTQSPMFRQTWSVCASNYGARFQRFCERRLHLQLGVLTVSALGGARVARSELPELIERAEREGRLNRLEAGLILRFDGELPTELADGRRLMNVQPRDISILRLEVLRPEVAARASRLPRCLPRPRTQGDAVLFGFTAGFAITGRVRDDEGEERPLVFLRIRSHLRTLGLGRRAIYRMISEGRTDRLAVPRNALFRRIYRSVDRERFEVLFQSALSEQRLCMQSLDDTLRDD